MYVRRFTSAVTAGAAEPLDSWSGHEYETGFRRDQIAPKRRTVVRADERDRRCLVRARSARCQSRHVLAKSARPTGRTPPRSTARSRAPAPTGGARSTPERCSARCRRAARGRAAMPCLAHHHERSSLDRCGRPASATRSSARRIAGRRRPVPRASCRRVRSVRTPRTTGWRRSVHRRRDRSSPRAGRRHPEWVVRRPHCRGPGWFSRLPRGPHGARPADAGCRPSQQPTSSTTAPGDGTTRAGEEVDLSRFAESRSAGRVGCRDHIPTYTSSSGRATACRNRSRRRSETHRRAQTPPTRRRPAAAPIAGRAQVGGPKRSGPHLGSRPLLQNDAVQASPRAAGRGSRRPRSSARRCAPFGRRPACAHASAARYARPQARNVRT